MKTPEKIKKWYKRAEWIKVRNYIRVQRRGLCEDCGKRGEEVHHIIPLTLANFDDPMIRIHESNLQLVCRSCHMSKRSDNDFVRNDLEFDKDGNLIKKSNPPHPKRKN